MAVNRTTEKPSHQPELGRRLRELRLRRGFSQSDLAGEDLSTSAISLIESGRREPNPDTLRLVAERLDTTPDYLLNGRRLQESALFRLRIAKAKSALVSGDSRGAAEEMELLHSYMCDDPDMRREVALLRIQVAAANDPGASCARRVRDSLEGREPGSIAEHLLVVEAGIAESTRSVSREAARHSLSELVDRVGVLGLEGTGLDARSRLLCRRLGMEVGPSSSTATLPLIEQAVRYTRASRKAEEREEIEDAVWLAEAGSSLAWAATEQAEISLERAELMVAPSASGGEDSRAFLQCLLDAQGRLEMTGLSWALARGEARIAEAYLALGEWEESEQWARRALRGLDEPGAGDEHDVLIRSIARLTLARALSERSGGADRELSKAALSAVDEAISDLETLPPSRECARGWKYAGEVLGVLGEGARALDAFQRALGAVGIP
ncbi:helix-turn-helix domain-containing protein [Nocardiopsis alba]|uniref:Helix-turn-helix domain-containing protein n=1 Tax=Nocardiopsis alba TaxID=53437 RepID=A0A7K2IPE2_9ACTN|nr:MULTISPECIES: helix-turn-helix transcriptional regulator [Nocardiopsis]MEC3894050.1 helix-turn-helix transcriptional regulator [Nocardiopsis sp. LDBS1602]MYR31665.1 helix-turn-helix domain-containing protein [Nocardiopsis alba]